ncbi:hypothetical protein BD408DRAFT_480221 [Parasitella parasitica]|nr:hypothetical protein BD408DRAFT_480221 [Parasitella parasitica]
MSFQALNYPTQQRQIQTQMASSSSAKRKFEDESEQFLKVKKLHFFDDEPRQKHQLMQHLMHVTTHASFNYTPSPNAIANFANQSMGTNPALFGMITPPAEHLQQLQSQEEHDISMMEEDYTDEDESLQTPSYMNNYNSCMATDVEEDIDDGYIGQLEGGWSEMFSFMDYPHYNN